jgi:hypothetical protein
VSITVNDVLDLINVPLAHFTDTETEAQRDLGSKPGSLSHLALRDQCLWRGEEERAEKGRVGEKAGPPEESGEVKIWQFVSMDGSWVCIWVFMKKKK